MRAAARGGASCTGAWPRRGPAMRGAAIGDLCPCAAGSGGGGPPIPRAGRLPPEARARGLRRPRRRRRGRLGRRGARRRRVAAPLVIVAAAVEAPAMGVALAGVPRRELDATKLRAAALLPARRGARGGMMVLGLGGTTRAPLGGPPGGPGLRGPLGSPLGGLRGGLRDTLGGRRRGARPPRTGLARGTVVGAARLVEMAEAVALAIVGRVVLATTEARAARLPRAPPRLVAHAEPDLRDAAAAGGLARVVAAVMVQTGRRGPRPRGSRRPQPRTMPGGEDRRGAGEEQEREARAERGAPPATVACAGIVDGLCVAVGLRRRQDLGRNVLHGPAGRVARGVSEAGTQTLEPRLTK
mmetsp:Transcript_118471/g.335888  ORF Transcript_118471/g.335888 Transcript_118471/m.335888 type:complete len:355 (+) Transcript_118471:58-1122(+)